MTNSDLAAMLQAIASRDPGLASELRRLHAYYGAIEYHHQPVPLQRYAAAIIEAVYEGRDTISIAWQDFIAEEAA